VRIVPVLLVLCAMSVAACSKDIGDECTTNVDCEQNLTRDCDLSQPGGYCTVNGCDEKLCPSEGFCVRVFPYEYKTPANTCAQDSDCLSSDQLCLPDVPTGYCVPRVGERRFCVKSCGSNDDCRAGYECREAAVEGNQPKSSTYGSLALVANANQSTVAKFCAPAVSR
jgi:hypothetical protein